MQISSLKSVAYLVCYLSYAYSKPDTDTETINYYEDNLLSESIYSWGNLILKSNKVFQVLTIYLWLLLIRGILRNQVIKFDIQLRIQFIIFFIFASESDHICSVLLSTQEIILIFIYILYSRNPRENFKSIFVIYLVLTIISFTIVKSKLNDLIQILYTYVTSNLWAIPLYCLFGFSHSLILAFKEIYIDTYNKIPEKVTNKLIFMIFCCEKRYGACTFYGILSLSIIILPEIFFQISKFYYPNSLLIEYIVIYLYSLPLALLLDLYSGSLEIYKFFKNVWPIFFSLIFYKEILIYLFDIDNFKYRGIISEKFYSKT